MVSMIHPLPSRLVRSRHRDQPGNTRNARRHLSRRRFFEAVRTEVSILSSSWNAKHQARSGSLVSSHSSHNFNFDFQTESLVGINANARGVSAAGIRLSAANYFEPLEGQLRAQLNGARVANGGYLT